jgi:hypothetical protein
MKEGLAEKVSVLYKEYKFLIMMGKVTEPNREPNYDDCTKPESEGSSVYFHSFASTHGGVGCIATLSVGRL